MNCVTIPLRVAFYEEWSSSPGSEVAWFCLNLLLDVAMGVDMWFGARRFATVSEGLLISDVAEFRGIYLRGRFKYDLVGMLPVDGVLFLAGVRVRRTLALVRMGRFIGLGRFVTLMQSLIDFFEEQGVRAKAGVWHCLRMIILVLLTSHWFGCVFYYIAYLEGLESSDSWTGGTLYEDSGISMKEKYTVCLYWAVYTITLVGYGDITIRSKWEMLFCIVCMISGAVLCDAGITAILSSLVHAMDASAGESQAWTQVITRYMKHAKMPEDLQEQIYG